MVDTHRSSEAIRWIAGALSGLLVVVLVTILLTEGWTRSRLSFFSLVAVVALAGLAGVSSERPVVTAVSGVAIVLLGFWQAVLGAIMMPTGLLLVSAAILVWRRTESSPGASPG